MTHRPVYLLPAIVFSQFAGTSLWFAGNAVLADLQAAGGLGNQGLQWITQAVQFGFICGTLVFAVLAVADRWSPRLVFLLSSAAGALANLAGAYLATDAASLMLLRFATGFFLAGIYPVGMKVAAGWYERGLGGALGLLVGALVLGTAFPHLLQTLNQAGLFAPEVGAGETLAARQAGAQLVLAWVSLLALAGGVVLYLCVPDGPYLPRNSDGGRSSFSMVASMKAITGDRGLRRAALGYFGHMWELYAFWAFLPVCLGALFAGSESQAYAAGIFTTRDDAANVPLWSFLIIAVGFFGCALGGFASLRLGSARVAGVQLAISGALCLLSPVLFHDSVPLWLALSALFLWGITVIGDSPQFSALVAAAAPRELVGSALTIVNSIGFALTLVSIELVGWWSRTLEDPAWLFVVLAPGPAIGLLALAARAGNQRDSA